MLYFRKHFGDMCSSQTRRNVCAFSCLTEIALSLMCFRKEKKENGKKKINNKSFYCPEAVKCQFRYKFPSFLLAGQIVVLLIK